MVAVVEMIESGWNSENERFCLRRLACGKITNLYMLKGTCPRMKTVEIIPPLSENIMLH